LLKHPLVEPPLPPLPLVELPPPLVELKLPPQPQPQPPLPLPLPLNQLLPLLLHLVPHLPRLPHLPHLPHLQGNYIRIIIFHFNLIINLYFFSLLQSINNNSTCNINGLCIFSFLRI
jgi:hypothetical protein